jgi:hypothetical protein
MYVRLKRQRQTVFLHVDPTDTVAQMKAKLADVVQQVGQGAVDPNRCRHYASQRASRIISPELLI